MKRNIHLRIILLLCLLLLFAMPSLGKASKMRRIPAGAWGGTHIRLDVGPKSASVEYDCAQGTINGPLTLNSAGNFTLRGAYIREHGGPTRQDETADSHPATYTGWTDGKTMKLTVILADTGEELGTFMLRRGQQGRVWKCK